MPPLHLAHRRPRPALLLLAVLGVASLLYLNTQHQQRFDGFRRYQQLAQVDFREPQCTIPRPDPWDPTIRAYVQPAEPLRCSRVQPTLTHLSRGHLILNQTAVREAGFDEHNLSCQFRCFWRRTDNENKYGAWTDVVNEAKVDCEFVEVKCRRRLLRISVYHQIHAQLVPFTNNTQGPNQKYSVTLFVIDSVSQQHFYRGLNTTLSTLTSSYNSKVFHGFAKVADNSFPNAIAFLAGKNVRSDQLPGPISGDFFDNWPLIWRDFEQAGHVTLYAEDYPNYNLFNYLSNGFHNQPVDHYFRPFWVEVYSSMVYRRSTYLCYNTDPLHLLQLRYLGQFLEAYGSQRPYFALSWLTELAHDRLSQVSVADLDLAAFFQHHQPQLRDHFLFVLADHGHRFDAIRQTMIGRLEERMPFFSMHVPEGLLKRVSRLADVLEWNSHQLTSFYDLYVTLLDILHLNEQDSWHELNTEISFENTTDPALVQPVHRFRTKSARGLSLLRVIPRRLSCAEAAIPEEYCICENKKSVPTSDPTVQRAAHQLINHLNTLLKSERSKCAKLGLRSVQDSTSSLPSPGVVRDAESGGLFSSRSYSLGVFIDYVVVVRAAPSDAVFEATVRHDLASAQLAVVGDVNRINRYGNQSECIRDPVLQKFCFCL